MPEFLVTRIPHIYILDGLSFIAFGRALTIELGRVKVEIPVQSRKGEDNAAH